MTITDTIPITSIDFGLRGRTEYNGIEDLADSIEQNGLVQPIVLRLNQKGGITIVNEKDEPQFILLAGGRRLTALLHKHEQATLGDPNFTPCPNLYHGSSSDPLRPGFILAGEADPLTQILRELAENNDREDPPWRDAVRLTVKAYHMAKTANDVKGIYYTQKQYGAMLIGGYADLGAAVAIVNDLNQNPERYAEVNTINQAYSVLLKANAVAMAKLAAEKELSLTKPLTDKPQGLPSITVPGGPAPEPLPERTQGEAVINPEFEHPIIPLSTSFICANALDFMESCEPESFDHIITDPDYAISVERLSAKNDNIRAGVAQKSVEDSLADLYRFLPLAFKVTKRYSFLVFFYDIEHHEKLQKAATDAGWRTQRWPLTWRKLDYRSNGAPQHNFCKNLEWAMVCRKPDAVLAKVQMSSALDCPTGKVTKELSHPFAKPPQLWKWIFDGVAIKGQTVFDPFAGSGSCPIAALDWGLKPVGCEINPDQYANLMVNLQIKYKQILGDKIRFS